MVLDSLTPTILGPFALGSSPEITATTPLIDTSALSVTAYLTAPGEASISVGSVALGELAGTSVAITHNLGTTGLVGMKYVLEWIADVGGANEQIMFPNANVGNPLFLEIYDPHGT
jgi:hypothetical protein